MTKEKEEKKYETLIVQGAKYQTTFTKKFKNRKVWEAPNHNQIRSFLPGTIIDIMAKTGERVKAGQTILVLEAMKMHNNVMMPFDGEVVKILVSRDEVITKNQVMVEVRPL
ncbi:MAG TPA: acetyl-CoA carboxylase biotin carboxyl carrier protein subunit [Prolixibacteraceae bacterium]|nr:acetyl-CoA carboxylase biotin carboxyl carrier protein subunit [Prolixibacteraceae bacterium]